MSKLYERPYTVSMLHHFEYTDQRKLLKFLLCNFFAFPVLFGLFYVFDNGISFIVILILYILYYNILLSKIKLNSKGSAIITNTFVEFHLKKKIIINFDVIDYYKIDFFGHTTLKIKFDNQIVSVISNAFFTSSDSLRHVCNKLDQQINAFNSASEDHHIKRKKAILESRFALIVLIIYTVFITTSILYLLAIGKPFKVNYTMVILLTVMIWSGYFHTKKKKS